MAFVFISGKNNGYPCFASLPDIYSAKCTSSPYPESVFTLPLSGRSYPQKKILGYNFPTSVTSSPYPVSVFRCLGKLYNNGYPVKLCNGSIPLLGAFANATELTKAVIPQSCKYIGENAFTNTKLKSVRIASDCKYFSTSFPPGCAVNFY